MPILLRLLDQIDQQKTKKPAIAGFCDLASPKVQVEIPTINITSRCRLLRKRLVA